MINEKLVSESRDWRPRGAVGPCCAWFCSRILLWAFPEARAGVGSLSPGTLPWDLPHPPPPRPPARTARLPAASAASRLPSDIWNLLGQACLHPVAGKTAPLTRVPRQAEMAWKNRREGTRLSQPSVSFKGSNAVKVLFPGFPSLDASGLSLSQKPS